MEYRKPSTPELYKERTNQTDNLVGSEGVHKGAKYQSWAKEANGKIKQDSDALIQIPVPGDQRCRNAFT